jgi:hypothetical protein
MLTNNNKGDTQVAGMERASGKAARMAVENSKSVKVKLNRN